MTAPRSEPSILLFIRERVSEGLSEGTRAVPTFHGKRKRKKLQASFARVEFYDMKETPKNHEKGKYYRYPKRREIKRKGGRLQSERKLIAERDKSESPPLFSKDS